MNVLTGGIPSVPFGSNEQTNGKRFMDSNGILNSNESESVAHIKENNLQSTNEISLWKDNYHLYKNHILN